MPHGLTIDGDGNTYVTDVGLHQVMRVGEIKIYLLGDCAHYRTLNEIFDWAISKIFNL